jgi:DNA-binding PadR family transcriptional regulator
VDATEFSVEEFWSWSVLRLLSVSPRNGDEFIRFFQQPALDPLDAGSIFPTLEKLMAKGFVEQAQLAGGQRAYVLTDRGREFFESEPKPRFEQTFSMLLLANAAASELYENQVRLRMALLHVTRHGNDEQRIQASKIAQRACSEVYGLLAG